jgi:hypothetical protein
MYGIKDGPDEAMTSRGESVETDESLRRMIFRIACEAETEIVSEWNGALT